MATTYTYTAATGGDKYIIKLDSDTYTVNDGANDIFKMSKGDIEKLSGMINNGILSIETLANSLTKEPITDSANASPASANASPASPASANVSPDSGPANVSPDSGPANVSPDSSSPAADAEHFLSKILDFKQTLILSIITNYNLATDDSEAILKPVTEIKDKITSILTKKNTINANIKACIDDLANKIDEVIRNVNVEYATESGALDKKVDKYRTNFDAFNIEVCRPVLKNAEERKRKADEELKTEQERKAEAERKAEIAAAVAIGVKYVHGKFVRPLNDDELRYIFKYRTSNGALFNHNTFIQIFTKPNLINDYETRMRYLFGIPDGIEPLDLANRHPLGNLLAKITSSAAGVGQTNYSFEDVKNMVNCAMNRDDNQDVNDVNCKDMNPNPTMNGGGNVECARKEYTNMSAPTRWLGNVRNLSNIYVPATITYELDETDTAEAAILDFCIGELSTDTVIKIAGNKVTVGKEGESHIIMFTLPEIVATSPLFGNVYVQEFYKSACLLQLYIIAKAIITNEINSIQWQIENTFKNIDKNMVDTYITDPKFKGLKYITVMNTQVYTQFTNIFTTLLNEYSTLCKARDNEDDIIVSKIICDVCRKIREDLKSKKSIISIMRTDAQKLIDNVHGLAGALVESRERLLYSYFKYVYDQIKNTNVNMAGQVIKTGLSLGIANLYSDSSLKPVDSAIAETALQAWDKYQANHLVLENIKDVRTSLIVEYEAARTSYKSDKNKYGVWIKGGNNKSKKMRKNGGKTKTRKV